MMKKTLVSMFLGLAICCVSFLSGCSQPGETRLEGRVRHARVRRIRNKQLISDIDTLMLTDQPTKLTDKKIP
jgi:hypothetical protein